MRRTRWPSAERALRVKPVRIAGGQKQLACAISLRKFGFRCFKLLRGCSGAERVFLARSADGHRRRFVAFQQDGWDLYFFASGSLRGFGLDGSLGFQRRGDGFEGGFHLFL